MAAGRRPIDDFLWSILILGGLVIASVLVMWPRETRIDLRKSVPKATETKKEEDTASHLTEPAPMAAQTATSGVTESTTAPTSTSAPAGSANTPTPAPTQATVETPATPGAGNTPIPNTPGPSAESRDAIDRAMQAVDNGKWQEAEALFKGVLASDPQNETALTEMAMINLIDKKDPEAAMPYIHDALETNPQNETMLTEYVNAAKLTNKLPEAIDYLQSLEGKGAQVDLGIARAYQAMGDSEKAIPYFEKSVREGSNTVPSEQTLEDLSDAYAHAGNNGKANEALQNAIISAEQTAAQHGSDPAAKENLSYLKIKQASLLWEMGDIAKSKALIADLERTDPNNELLIALKKDMEQRGQATAP